MWFKKKKMILFRDLIKSIWMNREGPDQIARADLSLCLMRWLLSYLEHIDRLLLQESKLTELSHVCILFHFDSHFLDSLNEISK